MEWFSLWLPLVSQLVVPVALLAWLAFGRHAMKARSIAVAALVATYVLAIGIGGLWLVLPWWLPFAYSAVVVWTIARRLRGGDHRPQRPRAVWGLVVTVLIGALAVFLLGIVGLALAGRRPPGDPVDLTFPLGSGTYLVVNGGSQVLINAHLGTLEGGAIRALPRAELWRGSRAHQPRRPTRPRASSGRSRSVLNLWRSGSRAVSGASRVRGGWRG